MKLSITSIILCLFLIACNTNKEVVTKSNGKIKKKGFLDTDSLKTGTWKTFYPNGNIHKKTNYKKGKLDGKSIVYFLDDKVNGIANYKDGLKQGKFKTYYESGLLQSKRKYINDEPIGVEKSYYKNGQLKENILYDNKHRAINSKKYFENGKPWVVREIGKNGKGNSLYYNPEGQVVEEWIFENYELIIEKEYYSPGKISNSKEYERKNGDIVSTLTKDYNINGKLVREKLVNKNNSYLKVFGDSIDGYFPMERSYKEGLFKSHYHNGQLAEIGHYKRNWKDGLWKEFYRDGTLKFIGKYIPENPQLKDSIHTYYFPNGQIQKIEKYEVVKSKHVNGLLNTHKVGTWKEYYANGQLKESTQYEGKRAHKQGKYYAYYKNGNLKEEGNYYKSYFEGDYKFYYENGNLREHNHNLSMSLRDGLVESYYQDGTRKSKIFFRNNVKDGEYIKYFDNGNINVQGIYEYGYDNVGKWKYFYKNGGVAKEILYTDDEKIMSYYNPNGNKMAVMTYHRYVEPALKDIVLLDESGKEIDFEEFASLDEKTKITNNSFYYENVMGVLIVKINYIEDGKEKIYKKTYK